MLGNLAKNKGYSIAFRNIFLRLRSMPFPLFRRWISYFHVSAPDNILYGNSQSRYWQFLNSSANNPKLNWILVYNICFDDALFQVNFNLRNHARNMDLRWPPLILFKLFEQILIGIKRSMRERKVLFFSYWYSIFFSRLRCILGHYLLRSSLILADFLFLITRCTRAWFLSTIFNVSMFLMIGVLLMFKTHCRSSHLISQIN